MNKMTVKDVKDWKGKRVLVRCDFNVPMKDGTITDENRIIGALPTIKYLMEQGAKVILCSHMGKPHSIFSDEVKLNKKDKAKVEALPAEEQAAAKQAIIEKAKKDDLKKLTLEPVAKRLNELLDGKVTFAHDVVGPDAQAKVAACKEGECVLLENLRFHWEEEKKDLEFCKKLASFCDIYVNDAFGTAHRSHASTAAIVEYGLVKTAVCGFLIEKELTSHRRVRPRQDRRLRLPHREGAHRHGRLPRASRPPLRRHPRRCEGRRQAQRHQQPA